MKIEVLGTGCPKCQKTTKIIKKELKQADVDAEIEKIEDVNEITKAGVMQTPALGVDGEIKVEGNVPAAAEVKSWL